MRLLGLIAGTSLLEEKSFDTMESKRLENEFGTVQALFSEGLVYIPRHGKEPHDHILPHRINYRANLKAMKELGVTDIIGINSTGSLKTELEPGTIVVPDDYISITETPTIFDNKQKHSTPTLSEKIRQKLINCAEGCGISVITKGVYWQTRGPRLETQAEIRMMAQFADIVGMTMASEAVIASELGLEYGSICSVDNYGHGLVTTPLSMQEITASARKNADKILKIIQCCVKT
ncbi:MAG: 6-oxopurine nucleoside phosphorylase [Syntrophobacterales bacterium]|nr:MAG: 6-oxopurine nucleoside phosphorylase [Syntrophobacterales bacterium]